MDELTMVSVDASHFVLEQAKLDVKDKKRSNMFNWRGQFTPDFVSYLLDMYAEPGYVIADPFSGSGTVLNEAILRGSSCVGFEINPSAYYMSKFFEYARLTDEERLDMYADMIDGIMPIVRKITPEDKVFYESADYRDSYRKLLGLSTDIAEDVDRFYWPFLLNSLFLCERDKKMRLAESFLKNVEVMRTNLLLLPYVGNGLSVHLSDARNIGILYRDAIDLIITSPPYVNVFNYHQNYRGIIECFGYDVLKVASSEIGSNRKNRSNRFRTVVQYAEDMGHVLFSSMLSLRVGGIMVLVVGRESMVRKTRFFNSQIILDLVSCVPIIDVISCNTRHFSNRFGEDIKEDVIVLRRNAKSVPTICPISDFEEVGMRHVRKAAFYASDDLKEDLESVSREQGKILESPIYV